MSSSSKLAEISNCCNLINSAKVTEQGKGLSGLQLLLQDESAVNCLNGSSDSKRGPSWNTVFHSLFEYLRDECDRISQQYHSWPETRQKNKVKKLQDLFTFVKTFIRVANRGIARLKLVPFAKYLIELWEEKLFVKNHGVTFLKILSESIFTERKYCCELTKDTFDDLFRICGKEFLLTEETRKFDVSSLFLTLSRMLVNQIDAKGNVHFLAVFSSAVATLKLVKSSEIRENLLGALNLYVKWCSVSHRSMCCQLGEECLDIIIRAWMDEHSSETSKTSDAIIEFCSMQLLLHHPGYVIDDVAGYQVSDEEVWHRQLQGMLIAADAHLSKQQGGLSYRSRDDKSIHFNAECIQLVSDVFCILFQLVSRERFKGPVLGHNVSQLLKKINFHYELSILDLYTVEKGKKMAQSAKPWLQILNNIIKSHWEIFPFPSVLKIAVKFRWLYLNVNMDSIGESGLEVMCSVLDTIAEHFIDDAQNELEELSSIWKDCWTVASSCISQTSRTLLVDSALNLLTTLIKFDHACQQHIFVKTGVSNAAHHMWSSFCLHVCPTHNSLELVLAYGQTYGFQGSHADNTVFKTLLHSTSRNQNFSKCQEYDKVTEKEPLKVLLLHWILGYKEEYPQERHQPAPSSMSQMVAKEEHPSKPMILHNLTSGELSVELISAVVSLFCHKGCRRPSDHDTIKSSNSLCNDAVGTFLDPVFLATYKHFTYKELHLQKCEKVVPVADSTSLDKGIVKVVLHFLKTDMDILIETIADAKGMKTPSRISRLFRSFYTISNSAGLFLRYVLNNDRGCEYAQKFSEYWVQRITEVNEMDVGSMGKWVNLASDKVFISAVFEESRSLVSIFHSLKVVVYPAVFESTKSTFHFSLQGICERAMLALKSFSSQSDDIDSETISGSLSSRDESLGLTQSVSSSYSTSSGYKRRRYGGGDAPPAKHKRYSSHEQNVSIPSKASFDSQLSGTDVFTSNPYLNNAVSLISTLCKHSEDGIQLKKLVQLVSDLDTTMLQELRIIYLVFTELPSFSERIDVENGCEITEIFQCIFKYWYRDQHVSMKFLGLLANLIYASNKTSTAAQPFTAAIFDKAIGVLHIFWDFKTKGKCSYLVRMGILHSLFAVLCSKISKKITEQDTSENSSFATPQQALSALMSFLSDSNDAVKFLTTHLLKIIFSNLINHSILKTYQTDLLRCITDRSKHIFSDHNGNSTGPHLHSSILSGWLHALCAVLSHTDTSVEKEVHFQLCLFCENFQSLSNNSKNFAQMVHMISRTLATMAQNSALSAIDSSGSDKNHLCQYATKHLGHTLLRWTSEYGHDVQKALDAFPYHLFNFESMQKLCLENKRDTFSVICGKMKSLNELETVVRNFYLTKGCGQSERQCIKDLVLKYGADILAVFLPEKPLPDSTLQLLSNVMLTQNAANELGSLHIGCILVKSLMKLVPSGLESCDMRSIPSCLVKFCQPLSKAAKARQQSTWSPIIEKICSASPRGCHLLESFLCLREYFSKARYAEEMYYVIATYEKLVVIVLKEKTVSDEYSAYLLMEVVVSQVRYINLLQQRILSISTSEVNVHYTIKSIVSCIDVLLSLSEFIKNSSSCTERTVQHWNFVSPLASLIATLHHICAEISKFNTGKITMQVQNTLSEKVKLLIDSFGSITNSGNLHTVFTLIRRNEVILDVGLCIDLFENVFTVLENHNLLIGSGVLMDRMCDTLTQSLKNLPKDKSLLLAPKLREISYFLFKLTHSYSVTPSVLNCILETFRKLPLVPQMSNDKSRDTEDLIVEVLRTLVQIVVSGSYKISQSASESIYCVLLLPVVSSCWSKLEENDLFLSDFLSAFRIGKTLSIHLEVKQRGIEDLREALSHSNDIFSESYEDWICEFGSILLEFCSSAFFRNLKPVCCIVTKLSSMVMPHAIHNILVNDPTQKAKSYLTSYIRASFTKFLTLPKPSALKSMQAFLEVIQFLRSQSISEIESTSQRRGASSAQKKSTAWDNNFWLDIDYLLVAHIAAVCDKPFMAILSCEIWTEMIQLKKHEIPSKVSKSCRSLLADLDSQDFQVKPQHSTLQALNNEDHVLSNEDAISIQKQVLIRVYSEINDIDSLFGLRKGCSDNSELMMHIHESEHNWENALECYSRMLDKRPNDICLAGKILSGLKYSGLRHISERYREGAMSHFEDNKQILDDYYDEKQYHSSLKLTNWDDIFMGNCSAGLNRLFDCLACMNDEDSSLPRLLKHARMEIVQSISPNISHSVLNLTTLMEISNLFALKELEDAHALSVNKDESSISLTQLNWENLTVCADLTLFGRYDCTERILSNRNCILTMLKSKFADDNSIHILNKATEENLFMQIENAASSGKGKLALQKIESLKPEHPSGSYPPFKYYIVTLQEVEQLWNLGRKQRALSAAEDLMISVQETVRSNPSSRFENGFVLGKVLQLQGHWLNHAKVKGASTIMEDYFKKSVDIAASLRRSKSRQKSEVTDFQIEELCISGYESLAKFSDAQYQEVINYMKSNEFEQKRNLVREAQSEIKRVQSKGNMGQNQKYVILLQKNYSMDRKSFTDILERKEKFLLGALENYVKCLTMTDEHDILMYRICSLWFNNTQSSSLPGLMQCACKELKTHKFVELSYQLAARLNANSPDKIFQSTLEGLLVRVATDHPHHVLPILFALANARKDAEMTKSGGRKSNTQVNVDPTSSSAQSIIDRVKTKHPDLLTMMGDISNMYIQFANWDVSRYAKNTGFPISFDKSLLINRYVGPQIGEKYLGLAVPTVELPINKMNQYGRESTFISLLFFKNSFKLCGGINLPKIVVAVGSDGLERKHLVKGRDDLRQDSVMEHVFKVVNTMMGKEKDSQGLKLRTYKVVPLSQRSGLVEWCEGTMPIGNYLIGIPVQRDFGAHHRYHPKDLISLECRKKLSLVSGKPLHQKLETFADICKSFKPVFRHFFYEHFCNPMSWFHRRTAYCKSVAASSVVGYILGLGDRHVQNILIDCSSGEVIHIDFGVAFEQGKCLPTPEMVPFRLTRDIVDGFGSFGVEGTFRRSCERTVLVLRKSVDTISTIVEVLLHDPLHDWIMTSGKALQVQRHNVTSAESEMTSSVLNASTVAELLQNETTASPAISSRSSLAGRALLRVQEKLKGVESGFVLSVEGQVNLLIQQATDDERLCAMYAGWQPYI